MPLADRDTDSSSHLVTTSFSTRSCEHLRLLGASFSRSRCSMSEVSSSKKTCQRALGSEASNVVNSTAGFIKVCRFRECWLQQRLGTISCFSNMCCPFRQVTTQRRLQDYRDSAILYRAVGMKWNESEQP